MTPVRYTMTGVDGALWTFGGLDEPGCMIRHKGITGLGGANFSHEDRANVGEHGVTWNSTMYDPNIIGITVLRSQVFESGAQAVAVEKALRRSLSSGQGTKIGQFDATSEVDGEPHTRFQKWRLAKALDSPNYTLTHDLAYFEIKDVALRSDESWWRAKPVEKTYTAAQFATALIDNDGEEDVWPHFALTGPITLPKLGLLGETVALPTIGAGQTWTIETDPDWFEVRDHTGTERSAVGRRWYAKAPAETDGIPVTITGTGTTAATKLVVTLPQLYSSAA